ncbi:MAG: MBL fold metallo-hydrolase [Desulfobacteraceae bacterium]|nr:MAG: MBL fold metallo-hydrolase [Desulfobacteraceae bacterium]
METANTEITLTILGSGTCVPSLARSSCSVLAETGRDKILIDCGPGTMRRLLENGTEIFDISHILLSHFHPDHTGELVPFLFANKYPDGNRRKIPLSIIAGKGIPDFYAGLKTVFGRWIDLEPNRINIIELEGNNSVIKTDDIILESVHVEHNEESLAFRITGNAGGSFVYSGDTDFCDSLIDIARHADLFVCESAFPDEFKIKGHLTPSAAGEIAARAKVKKLLLTHFYPECDNFDVEKQCRRTYQGPLILGRDLMKVCIGAKSTKPL